MAAVATQILATNRRALYLITDSGAAGQTNTNVVDISTLPGAPSKVKVSRLAFTVDTALVTLRWDHTTDIVFFASAAGSGQWDFTQFGGLEDKGTGGAGDILLNVTATANFAIALEIEY